MRVLIVDDEAPARRKIARFLRGRDGFESVAEAHSATDALEHIRTEVPDLVFLDVQMPGGDGFSVLEAIAGDAHVPQIIFVTAHDRYAVRAFDACAVDYLLKPYDQQRFERALAKVRAPSATEGGEVLSPELKALLHELGASRRRYSDRLLVSQPERSYFLATRDVVRIEADRNRVLLYGPRQTHTLRSTMEALLERLDPSEFVQINRSNAVRIDAISELQPWFHGEYKVKLRDGTLLTWSRRYVARRPDLLEREG